MITFHIHYGNHLVSKLIRYFSNGNFNHVSIHLGDFIYEAKEGAGVIKTLVSKWDKSTVVESYSFEGSDLSEQRVFKFLEEQVGKGYDYTGILSFIWGFRHPVEGKFYCSELGFVTLAKWLNIPSESYDNQKVSPSLFRDILVLIK